MDCPQDKECVQISLLRVELADRWLANFQDHAKKMDEFAGRLAQVSGALDTFIPQIEHATQIARVAGELLPQLKQKTDDTMAESREARAAQAADRAARLLSEAEAKARLDLHDKMLVEARVAGAEGAAEASGKHRRNTWATSLAAVIIAVAGAVTAAYTREAPPAYTPAAASAR